MSQCTAVGNGRGGQQVTFDPALPGTPTPTTIDGTILPTGVACPSVTLCVAVDEFGHGVVGLPGGLTVGHASVFGTTASVRVNCLGSESCTIALKLSVLETLKDGKVIAVTARAKTVKKTVVVATETITIAARKSETVKLSLNGIGKKLLGKHNPLTTKFTIARSGRTVSSSTISFKARSKR